MIGLRFALLASIGLVGVNSQCLSESAALGTCLDEVGGFEDAAELACEACLEAIVLGAFAGPCEGVSSTVCADIADCPCGDLCDSNILSYMTCEINEERTGDDCPPIVCSTADTPTATPAAGDTPTAAPVTADTPTDAPAAVDTPTDTPATTGDDTASPTETPTPTSSASRKNPILFYKSLFGIVTVVGFLWN